MPKQRRSRNNVAGMNRWEAYPHEAPQHCSVSSTLLCNQRFNDWRWTYEMFSAFFFSLFDFPNRMLLQILWNFLREISDIGVRCILNCTRIRRPMHDGLRIMLAAPRALLYVLNTYSTPDLYLLTISGKSQGAMVVLFTFQIIYLMCPSCMVDGDYF